MKKNVLILPFLAILSLGLSSCENSNSETTTIEVSDVINNITIEDHRMVDNSTNEIHSNPELNGGMEITSGTKYYKNYVGLILPSGFQKTIGFRDIFENYNLSSKSDNYVFYKEQVSCFELDFTIHKNSFYVVEFESISYKIKANFSDGYYTLPGYISYDDSSRNIANDTKIHIDKDSIIYDEDGYVLVTQYLKSQYSIDSIGIIAHDIYEIKDIQLEYKIKGTTERLSSVYYKNVDYTIQ